VFSTLIEDLENVAPICMPALTGPGAAAVPDQTVTYVHCGKKERRTPTPAARLLVLLLLLILLLLLDLAGIVGVNGGHNQTEPELQSVSGSMPR
jgi:hypothetical protein